MSTATNVRAFHLLASLTLAVTAQMPLAHGRADAPGDVADGRPIVFPDTARHRTLVVDLHTHTVFSDGHVWPRIRVGEAVRDGLDALAITDHLEWQPHLADIPHPDRNRSADEAIAALPDGSDLMIVRGVEITRNAPAGHMNAVFVTDANALLRAAFPEDPADVRAYYNAAGAWPAQEAVAAANAQGAFVFWNHAWSVGTFPNGIPVPPDFHRDNAAAGLLHGIEVANGGTYSETAFQIALDHDLALVGVSDVHNLIDWDYAPHTGGHRPVTLALADARTPEALRAALHAKRTVVWFKNLLLGRPAHLLPLLEASLRIDAAEYHPGTAVLRVVIANASDARFQLENLSAYSFVEGHDLLEVPPHSNLEVNVRTGTRLDAVELPVRVLNALTAPKTPAQLTLTVPTAVVPTAPP